jgi:hypothetical protein
MAETRVAIDIQDVQNEAILDALLDEKAEIFKTIGGRRSVLIGSAALLRLTKRMSLGLEDGTDGNKILRG